ncbi:MAG: 16S rRNA processing protein RimM [bacterium]|nr:16S rRNA processing protein RimM [bacterium]
MSLRRKKPKIDQERVYLGKLSKPHALQGELKFIPFGCSPVLLEVLETVYLEGSETDVSELRVEYVRGTEKNPIIKFDGVDGRDQSEALSGAILWTKQELLPELNDGEIYESDLIGVQVINLDGGVIGRVESILETGAADVLVIRTPDGEEVMIPAAREHIVEFRRANQTLVVQPPKLDPAES